MTDTMIQTHPYFQRIMIWAHLYLNTSQVHILGRQARELLRLKYHPLKKQVSKTCTFNCITNDGISLHLTDTDTPILPSGDDSTQVSSDPRPPSKQCTLYIHVVFI